MNLAAVAIQSQVDFYNNSWTKHWSKSCTKIHQIFRRNISKNSQKVRHPPNANFTRCWVRFCSSTWNDLWSWNNNKGRRWLPKKTNWRKQFRSLLKNSWQAKRSWTLKTWFIVELYLRIYCIIMLGESNQKPYNITLKSPNHDKNCNRNYKWFRMAFILRKVTSQTPDCARRTRSVRDLVTGINQWKYVIKLIYTCIAA